LPSLVGNTFSALLRLERGAYGPACELARDVVTVAESRGERLAARSARLVEARACVALADLEAAQRTLDALGPGMAATAAVLSVRASLCLAQGAPKDALALADRALALRPARGDGPALCPPELALVRAEALSGAARPDEARHTLAAARRDIFERAEAIGDAELRSTFLERRAAHVRIFALCKRWHVE
jgi:eukaryotic-like serine/threonine-protein kinase